jgi:hypothetical protein
MKLIGKGIMLNASGGVPFLDYGDLQVNFGLDLVSIPRGDIAGRYYVPVGMPVSGRLSWFDLSADLLASLLGSQSDTGTVRRVVGESQTIPGSSPYSLDLNHGDILPATEVVLGGDGARFRRVSSSPDEGEYSIDEETLTFNSADAGKRVYVSYFYDDPSSGHKIVLSPQGLPTRFKLVGSLNLYDMANTENGDLVVIGERCVRTSPLNLGAAVGDYGRFSFEFALENVNPGDITLYMP